jgi:SagB-type dehydrogenase family enzyme
MKNLFIYLFVILLISNYCYPKEVVQIKLPPPQTNIGKPLMQALMMRSSSRTFSTKELPAQEISNILWAADGINRKESGKRTVPSAMNKQEVTIYISMKDGVYYYDEKDNSLVLVLKEDIRAKTGKQDFVKTAPLNLIYVADFAKMGEGKDEDKIMYSAADVGFIAENVYLYCASQNLSVVVRGSVDKIELAKILKLKPSQKIILTQTVGYPVE